MIHVILKRATILVILFLMATAGGDTVLAKNIVANNEALAIDRQNQGGEDYIVNGGGSSEVTITCSKGMSGRCFSIYVEQGLGDTCVFTCVFSGSQSNYCSPFYVNLATFCGMFAASMN